jgi:hypothetical protein
MENRVERRASATHVAETADDGMMPSRLVAACPTGVLRERRLGWGARRRVSAEGEGVGARGRVRLRLRIRNVLSPICSVYSRLLRIIDMSLVLKLGNSRTVLSVRAGRENASVRWGRRRQRSSQRPGCNGLDRVKYCQGNP